MALSAPTLSAAIKANLLADSNSQALNNAALTALCDAIAAAVVTALTTNGVVITTCPAGAGTGVIT